MAPLTLRRARGAAGPGGGGDTVSNPPSTRPSSPAILLSSSAHDKMHAMSGEGQALRVVYSN